MASGSGRTGTSCRVCGPSTHPSPVRVAVGGRAGRRTRPGTVPGPPRLSYTPLERPVHGRGPGRMVPGASGLVLPPVAHLTVLLGLLLVHRHVFVDRHEVLPPLTTVPLPVDVFRPLLGPVGHVAQQVRVPEVVDAHPVPEPRPGPLLRRGGTVGRGGPSQGRARGGTRPRGRGGATRPTSTGASSGSSSGTCRRSTRVTVCPSTPLRRESAVSRGRGRGRGPRVVSE